MRKHILESQIKTEQDTLPCRIVLHEHGRGYVTHLETVTEGDDGFHGHTGYLAGVYFAEGELAHALESFASRCKTGGFTITLPQ